MTPSAGDLSSGKGHRDENFPVASFLIARRRRPAVLAFYRVARMADDIADNAAAAPRDKDARLAAIEASLTGGSDDIAPAAGAARDHAGRARSSPRHILDLLEAFRRDVRKIRYENWAELMDYCRYSAAPVGRFVLEVHGESPATWPASDALCAALQVVNHLQDCGEDYRQLNRVYLPLDALGAAGADVTALRPPRASPALRGVITDLARRTLGLLDAARPLASEVRDLRLRLEIGVIHALATDLAGRLHSVRSAVRAGPTQASGGAGRGRSGGRPGAPGENWGSAKTQTGAIGKP